MSSVLPINGSVAFPPMRRALTLFIVGAALLGLPGQADAVTGKTTRFIAGFEGFVSCVYADPAGHATVGYGHLLHYGRPTRRDRRRWGCISNHRALKLLRSDLRSVENAVLARVRGAEVSPLMITALTSFAFNLGAGALDPRRTKGQPRATAIARRVRRGKYRRAGRDMLLYDGIIVGGKRRELNGLRIRRRKEYRLMIRGIKQLKRCQSRCGGGGSSGGLGPG